MLTFINRIAFKMSKYTPVKIHEKIFRTACRWAHSGEIRVNCGKKLNQEGDIIILH